MKVLKISLKNINSLKGFYSIDFTGSDYRKGLFGITGETGSGKTSIFDAFTLAMYGQTPRQKNISSGNNEVMTRGTGECEASVIFLANDSKIYKASWYQHRANKRPDENLQVPKHTLFRLASPDDPRGDKITLSNKEVPEEVAKLTGVDFETFTKIVLLPQGDFAGFFEAKGDEKTKILEKLLGIDIYEKIGKAISQMWTEQKDELERIKNRLDETKKACLSDDERHEAEERQRVYQAERARLAAEKETNSLLKGYLERERELSARKKDLDSTREGLTQDWNDFARGAETLEKGEKAARAEEERRRRDESRQKLEETEKGLPGLQKAAADASDAWQKSADAKNAAKNAADQARRFMEEKEPLWKDIEEQNQQIAEKSRALSQKNSDRNGILAAISDLDAKISKDKTELRDILLPAVETAQKACDEAQTRLNDASAAFARCDLSAFREALKEGEPCPLCGSRHHDLSAVQNLGDSLETLQKNQKKAQKEKDAADKLLKKKEDDVSAKKTEIASDEKVQKVHHDRLEALNRDIETCKQALEILRGKRQAAYSGDPAADRTAASDACKKAQAALEKCGSDERSRENAKNTAEYALRTAQDRRDEEKEAAARCQTVFEEKLKVLGYDDEAQWAHDRCNPEKLNALKKQRQSLLDRKSSLDGAEGELNKALYAHHAQKAEQAPDLPDGLSAEALAEKIETCKVRDKDLGTQIGVLDTQNGSDSTKLAKDQQNRQKRQELQKEHNRLEAEVNDWTELTKYTGGKDGKKLRAFVQEKLFGHFIDAASEQLKHLTIDGRYCLDRKKGTDSKGIEFAVRDRRYGQVLAASNISGGERFIVSLALALALSQNIRGAMIDSLFLDEGFGTLDETALNTVMNALDNLRSSGKMIGVISHRAEVREALAEFPIIEVIKMDGGASTLRGPGVASPETKAQKQ